MKKYIKKENEKYFQLFLNKIKDTKVRRITNKKYNSDYSCDLIFIIKNIFISISIYYKNYKNNILYFHNVLFFFFNLLYNNFLNFYKPIDEIISFFD